jgi:hypothetical protein
MSEHRRVAASAREAQLISSDERSREEQEG